MQNITKFALFCAVFSTAFALISAPVDDDHDHSADEAPGAHAEQPAATSEAEEPPVHLSPAQLALIQLRLSQAKGGNLDQTLRLNGEIQLNADQTVKLMPRMPGFVTAVEATTGSVVQRGQVLAKLTSHKLGEYYADYNSAAELEKLTLSELRMAQKLRDQKAIAEREYLRYERDYADAVIAKERAETMLRSLLLDPAHDDHEHPEAFSKTICTEYDILSPLNGTVIARDISVGENFAEDNTRAVFTISNLQALWLDLRATSTELRQLKVGLEVSASPVGSAEVHSGKIIYIAPVIDETTRTGLVRVLIDNADGDLRPGEFAVATILPPPGSAETVLIEREAVQLIAGETVVFVPQADGFAPKVVVVGKSAGGMTQILSGLQVGAEYVAGGAFELKAVLLTSGMDAHAGHGH